MALKCTPYIIKTSTGSARVQTCVDVSTPGNVPYIADKDGTQLYRWNESEKKWGAQGALSEPINSRNGGFSNTETYGSILNQNDKTFTDNTVKIINDNLNGSPASAAAYRQSSSFLPWNQWVAKTAPAPAATVQSTGTTPADQQAGTTPPTGTTGTTTPLPQGTGTDLNAGWKEPTSGMTLPAEGAATNYRYPFLISDEQDCIRFEIFGLKRNSLAKFEENVVAGAFRNQTVFGVKGDSGDASIMYKKIDNTPPIIIGIQGQIIDQNTVNWGAGELNELQRMGAELSAKTMTSPKSVTDAFGDLLTGIKGAATKNSTQLQSLLYSAFLEQAVSAPGLLSRIAGGILNPNMELLFQGPQLRPFNFNFKMSPRSKDEADSVKRIIRAFKRNMAPRVNNLFLQSPNVFKITYIKGSKETSSTHQSINLIKMCSLQNCSVDYTPLQTYMTYEDQDASMVSYNMSLSFSEITPIYQNDYDAEANHPIGF